MNGIVFVLLATVAGPGEAPRYAWRSFSIPRELWGEEGPETVQAELAISGAGSEVFVATWYGATLVRSDTLQRRWCVAFKLVPRGVGFLGDDRLVLSTQRHLVQLARSDGHVLKRVPCRVDRFAVLRTGLLVGQVPTADGSRWAHAVISPEDGRPLLGLGDEHASMIQEVVVDHSGTVFATGGLFGDVYIGDPYVRALRRLTATYATLGEPVHALRFHPSGRYLAVSWRDCRVAVLDLLEPGEWELEKAPGQLGQLASKGSCRGIGFIGSHWLWCGTKRELVVRRWPGNGAPHSVTPPGKADFYVWRGSNDGNLLAGLDLSGMLWLGRLVAPIGNSHDHPP